MILAVIEVEAMQTSTTTTLAMHRAATRGLLLVLNPYSCCIGTLSKLICTVQKRLALRSDADMGSLAVLMLLQAPTYLTYAEPAAP